MSTLIPWDAWIAVYLRSWFHLDWDDDFESADDVLNAKLSKLDADVGRQLLKELNQFVELAREIGEAEAARNLRELTIFTRTPREKWDAIPFLEHSQAAFKRFFG
jgi:hypothetical protein